MIEDLRDDLFDEDEEDFEDEKEISYKCCDISKISEDIRKIACPMLYMPEDENGGGFVFPESSRYALADYCREGLNLCTHDALLWYLSEGVALTAELFYKIYCRILRYGGTSGTWYLYDGVRWMILSPKAIGMIVRIFISELCQILKESSDAKAEKSMKSLLKESSVRTIEKSATPLLMINESRFDTHGDLLNVRNGTLDLGPDIPIDRRLREHRPEDYITKVIDIDFKEAESQKFNQFIDEIACHNRALVDYLQMILGYTLNGSLNYLKFFIFYGPLSQNGKSTLMELLLKTLGEYATVTSPNLLSDGQSQDPARPSPQLSALIGKRMVYMSEPNDKHRLGSDVTKKYTGGERIDCRALYGNKTVFIPQFTMIMLTNDLVRADDSALFLSDRLVVVPFNRHFTAEEKNRNILAELSDKAGCQAVLYWLIQGLSKIGPDFNPDTMPECVCRATEEYRMESDTVEVFISEHVKHTKGKELRTKKLYDIYVEWCDEEGNDKVSRHKFNTELRRNGYIIKQRRPMDQGEKTTMINDCELI